MRWAFAAPWVCVLASAQMSFNTDNVSTACWVFFWWRTATVRVIARMLWEMQVWRCGHDWIYFSAVLLACSLPGTSLITHTGPGSHAWAVHGLGMCMAKQATGQLTCKQSSSSSSWARCECSEYIWETANSDEKCAVCRTGYTCQNSSQIISQTLSKALRSFSGKQNTKWPEKSGFWVITKTTEKRKKCQQFCVISFVLYLHIFSTFSSPDRISGCAMLVLIGSGKTKQSRSLSWHIQCPAAMFPPHSQFLSFSFSATLKSEVLHP